MTDLTERLLTRLRELNTTDDHARGCQGREYHCSCDYDIRVENAVFEAITALETLTQENARLREAGWRGIESAPTDPEDPILLLLYEWHDMGGFMFVGTFDHAKSQWFNNLDHQTQHPTHWMPLPPDPARKALGGGDEQ